MTNGFDYERSRFNDQQHVGFVIEHQFESGWSEKIEVGAPPSPLVTSQMIIGLLPHLDLDLTEPFKGRISAAIKTAIGYLDTEFRSPGWSDHSGGVPLIDATGAVVTAMLYAKARNIEYSEALELPTKFQTAVQFLIDEQNDDGGWGIRKTSESRIQFTYWSVLALVAYRESSLFHSDDSKQLFEALEKSSRWLKSNFEANASKAFSIRKHSQPNPVATAMGIELFKQLNISFDSQNVIEYLRVSRQAIGRWQLQTDEIIHRGIPRRVYVLSDWARIVDCLHILGLPLTSNLIQDALHNIRELELPGGGFKHSRDDIEVFGWFTAQVLRMLGNLKVTTEIPEDGEIAGGIRPPIKRTYGFSRAALMIGRFRPPHMGHYVGLKAILFGSERDFSLPEDVLKDLTEIDKVFIGITRYTVLHDTPWSVGEVQDIWRHILDNDEELKSKSDMIEIVSCPAEQDTTNIADAIDGLTSVRDSVIVISGNDRVLQQCDKNGIKCCRFARYNESISGTIIRRLVAEIDWDNLGAYTKQLQELKEKLHPVAFSFMLERNLFKKAQSVIRAR